MPGKHSRGKPAPLTVRNRPALRIALLSLATAILLLGAATAGVYGYAAIRRSQAAGAAGAARTRAFPTDKLDISPLKPLKEMPADGHHGRDPRSPQRTQLQHRAGARRRS